MKELLSIPLNIPICANETESFETGKEWGNK